MTTTFQALRTLVLGCFLAVALQGCGGGGGGSSSPTTTTPSTPGTTTASPTTSPSSTPALITSPAGANVVPVVVHQVSLASNAPNVVYATVTVCAPDGSHCVAVPNVLVDTASTGLRLNASVLSNLASLPRASATDGNPLSSCYTFLDGYFWGSVRTANVQLGNETVPAIPIQVVNDSTSGAVPAGCTSAGSNTAENSPATIIGNGILGVEGFLQDCGSACANSLFEGFYYSCPTAGCTAIEQPLADQIPNPVARLGSTDNNGVVLRLPAIPATGASSVTGSLLLGVGSQANNSVSNATVLTVDPVGHTFVATYNGTAMQGSFIDSGSNGLFFYDSTIPTCPLSTWYCPTSTLSLNATFTGENNTVYNVPFSVANANTLFATANLGFNNLGGGAFVGASMDFGMPFFYGKDVFVVNEGASVPGTATTGPFVAFSDYTND